MAKKHRMIIQFRGGLGQGLALLYALRSPDVQVAGIICRKTSMKLVSKLIEFAQPGYEIPVVAGAQHPLFSGNVDTSIPEGVQLLTEASQDEESEWTLVTFDYLTTLALAAAREPQLAKAFTRMVVQGGAIRVPGDVTPIAEANMHRDPEAASFVLAAQLPLLFVPLDVTQSLRLTEEQVRSLTSLAHFSGLMTEEGAGGAAVSSELKLHALVAMVAALTPHKIRTEQMKLTVECQSPLSRGAILADLRAKPSVGIDTSVCVEVDTAEVEQWLHTIWDQGGV